MNVLFGPARLPAPVESSARAYLVDGPPEALKTARLTARVDADTMLLLRGIARARGWTTSYLLHHGLELVAAEALGAIGPRHE
ncbi:MAG: hypothetical protein OXJ62_00530 [Spirochaetaceae bacterium]|nr:hypothetical protein [Spirochaetaceae bacterium]